MEDEKVYLKCSYVYERKGKDVFANYISPNHSQNLTNPNVIASILKDEILISTGHIVKEFLIVGKDPVKEPSTLN